MLRPNNRRRLRWSVITLASLTAGAVLAGTSSQAATSSPKATAAPSPKASAIPTLDPNNPTPVRIADAATSNVLAIVKGEGFFKKYGLDPTISSLNSGVNVIAALQGGSIDYGYADFYAGINAISNGFDLALVSPNNYNLHAWYVGVKSDGPIKTPADLAGKSIGVSPVPQIRVNARGFLKSNGVNPDSVKFTIISDPNSFAGALDRGSIDAWGGPQYLNLAQNDGQHGYNFKSIGNPSTAAWSNPKATTAAFWSTGNTARSNPAVAYAVNFALHDFHKWWNQTLSLDDKVALYKKYYNIDYNALAGGNRERLQNLIPDYWQSDPIDLTAGQSWYQDGLAAASDLIASNVDWQSHVFASAKAALPSAAAAAAKPATTPKPTAKPTAKPKATPKPTSSPKKS